MFHVTPRGRARHAAQFGIEVDEDEIPCRGITDVTATDFEYAGLIVSRRARHIGARRHASCWMPPVFSPREPPLTPPAAHPAAAAHPTATAHPAGRSPRRSRSPHRNRSRRRPLTPPQPLTPSQPLTPPPAAHAAVSPRRR
eukprot:4466294-Prymnesium_polylepis.1